MRIVLIGAAIGVAAIAGAAAGQSAAPVVPGVYAASQAERGLDEYSTSCAHCHRSDLLGDERAEVPSLAGDSFMVRWEGRPLSALFEMISKDMPADDPGRLSARSCLDIVAYILQTNGYPAGPQELPANPAALKGILIEKK